MTNSSLLTKNLTFQPFACALLIFFFGLCEFASANQRIQDRNGECVVSDIPATLQDWPRSTHQLPDFKSIALNSVQTLINQGYRNFGQLDLQKFFRDIQSVEVTYVAFLRYQSRSGTERASACWRVQGRNRSIRVNHWMWAYTESTDRSTISLHEFLGAFGFQDEHYEISAALSILSQSSESTLQPELIPSLRNIRRGQQLAGGSVTGVGGGGDWIASKMKLAMYRMGLDELARAQTLEERRRAIEFLNQIPRMRVEIRWN